jgi:hypothetical protein
LPRFLPSTPPHQRHSATPRHNPTLGITDLGGIHLTGLMHTPDGSYADIGITCGSGSDPATPEAVAVARKWVATTRRTTARRFTGRQSHRACDPVRTCSTCSKATVQGAEQPPRPDFRTGSQGTTEQPASSRGTHPFSSSAGGPRPWRLVYPPWMSGSLTTATGGWP